MCGRYALLAMVILHPVPLLFSTTRFRIVDVVFPVRSPNQPLENSIGAIALYCVVLVVVTSYFRLRLGRRLWKAFHFVIYAAVVAIFCHSIFTDPTLKHAPVDPFDGEKVFIEACCILTAAIGILRGATLCAKQSSEPEPRRSAKRRPDAARFPFPLNESYLAR
jgi:DMSO/TMAO reductase YedYZ heme-binding membrane subunit